MPPASSVSLPIVMTVTAPDPTAGGSPVDCVLLVGTSDLNNQYYVSSYN